MEHPYKELEELVLWQAMDKAVADLEANQDIELRTPREYIVGYLCKCMIEGYSVDDDDD